MGNTARRVAPSSVSAAQLFAFRQKRQRLDQRTTEPLAQLVREIGWVPTTGGSNPYLSFRARAPRWDRHLVDQAVFGTGELAEVPTPRGFALAPSSEAWLPLWAARQQHDRRSAAWRKAVDGKKLGRLKQDLLNALRKGPATQEGLRANEPDSLCSALPAEARAAGLPTHFALALRELQLDGFVVRRQREQRLDRRSVMYALPKLPLATEVSRERAVAGLVRRHLDAFGAVTGAAFARWSGLTEAEAIAALDAAGLERFEVEGQGTHFATSQDQAELWSFAVPVPPRLSFVPHEDPLLASVVDGCVLIPESHRSERVTGCDDGGKGDPSRHVLVIGGRIAGVWAFDPDERRVEYATFAPLATRMRRAADDAADQLASFIADELDEASYGDGREEEDLPSIEALQARWRSLTGVK